MKAVYKFYYSSYYGDLYGLFVATKEEVNKIIGLPIRLGEVLGKYSDVIIEITRDYIPLVSDDPHIVTIVEEEGLSFGYNPFHYLREERMRNEAL